MFFQHCIFVVVAYFCYYCLFSFFVIFLHFSRCFLIILLTTQSDILNLPHTSEDSISHIDSTWVKLNFLKGFQVEQPFCVLFRQPFLNRGMLLIGLSCSHVLFPLIVQPPIFFPFLPACMPHAHAILNSYCMPCVHYCLSCPLLTYLEYYCCEETP